MKFVLFKNKLLVLYALILLLWIFGFIIFPHLGLIYYSFINDEGKFTLANYLKFFKNRIYYETFFYTFLNGFWISFLCLIVALPVSFFMVKVVSKTFKNFLLTLFLIPLAIGELIVVYGWMLTLSDKGPIVYFLNLLHLDHFSFLYNKFSMTLGFFYVSFIFMLLPLIQAMENLDNYLIEAALDLGAPKWRIFKEIVIPFVKPGIVSGIIMVFTLVIGDFLVPNILGGKSALWFTQIIYDNFLTALNWHVGSAFGFLLLFGSIVIIWCLLKITKEKYTEVIKNE